MLSVSQTIQSAFSVISCQITPVFTFLDYVQAGTKLHLIFSIDFTSEWVANSDYEMRMKMTLCRVINFSSCLQVPMEIPAIQALSTMYLKIPRLQMLTSRPSLPWGVSSRITTILEFSQCMVSVLESLRLVTLHISFQLRWVNLPIVKESMVFLMLTSKSQPYTTKYQVTEAVQL